MSLKDVRVVVENFLKSDTSQAIAISGKWGSGKTYFWKKVIIDASKQDLIKKYSYVSLFGINNLSDLKAAIFDNAVSAKDVDTGASSSTWVENARAVIQSSSLDEVKGQGRHFLNMGRKNISQVIPIMGSWGGLARSLSFFAIKDYVICLDDVERKGADLPLKDILGFVSMLKEQRSCRVVVILNEDELGTDKTVLDAFKEKVFDGGIFFSPSVEECAKLVFTDEWAHSKSVTEKVILLGIKNIRILQRIRCVIEILLPYVEGKDEAILRQLIHSSVLLTWCYNCRESTVPSYEMVRDASYAALMMPAKKVEKSDSHKAAEKVLSDYGYLNSDKFDLQICNFLEKGYVIDDEFVSTVDAFQDLALKNNHSISFNQAWLLFHDTFDDNEKELVSSLRQGFLAKAIWIHLGNAMGTVRLMRELGYEDIADELMNHWIEMAKLENKDLLDLRSAFLSSESIDAKFMDAVKNAYYSERSMPALGDTIREISGMNGWNPEHIEALSNASVDEYFYFFRSIGKDMHLDTYIRTCLQFGSFINNDEEKYKNIYAMTVAALKRIASENRLNEIRVSRFLPAE